MPTPHASQGINQGFYVRRSHSGQAAGDMTDSGEDPDEPPAAREALGPDSAARGAHMAAPAAPSTEQVVGMSTRSPCKSVKLAHALHPRRAHIC